MTSLGFGMGAVRSLENKQVCLARREDCRWCCSHYLSQLYLGLLASDGLPNLEPAGGTSLGALVGEVRTLQRPAGWPSTFQRVLAVCTQGLGSSQN